jgi:hypothetical protein
MPSANSILRSCFSPIIKRAFNVARRVLEYLERNWGCFRQGIYVSHSLGSIYLSRSRESQEVICNQSAAHGKKCRPFALKIKKRSSWTDAPIVTVIPLSTVTMMSLDIPDLVPWNIVQHFALKSCQWHSVDMKLNKERHLQSSPLR